MREGRLECATTRLCVVIHDMIESRIHLLQSMPIFGGIDENTLELILRQASYIELKKGKHFFREGESAATLYVLETGSVTVYRTWKGLKYPLRTLGAGDCFGEMALIDCSPRSASVQASQRCQAIEISTSLFAEIYSEYPQQYTLIHMNMGRELCRRLRDADTRLFMANVVDH